MSMLIALTIGIIIMYAVTYAISLFNDYTIDEDDNTHQSSSSSEHGIITNVSLDAISIVSRLF